MTEETPEIAEEPAVEVEAEVVDQVQEALPEKVEASVWRLGPGGLLLSSVYEFQAAWLAESEPQSIFFYADLEGSANLTATADTLEKVYRALAAQGLSERQIIDAVADMQNQGLYFRESLY